MNGRARSDAVVMVAVLVLGFEVFTSIVCITIVAVATERDVSFAEQLTAGAVLLIALLGGLIVRGWENRPPRSPVSDVTDPAGTWVRASNLGKRGEDR